MGGDGDTKAQMSECPRESDSGAGGWFEGRRCGAGGQASPLAARRGRQGAESRVRRRWVCPWRGLVCGAGNRWGHGADGAPPSRVGWLSGGTPLARTSARRRCHVVGRARCSRSGAWVAGRGAPDAAGMGLPWVGDGLRSGEPVGSRRRRSSALQGGVAQRRDAAGTDIGETPMPRRGASKMLALRRVGGRARSPACGGDGFALGGGRFAERGTGGVTAETELRPPGPGGAVRLPGRLRKATAAACAPSARPGRGRG